jgi:predicted small secreted protein
VLAWLHFLLSLRIAVGIIILVFQYMIHRRSHKENDSSKSKNAKDKNQRKELRESNAHIEDTQKLDIEIEMLQKLYCIW